MKICHTGMKRRNAVRSVRPASREQLSSVLSQMSAYFIRYEDGWFSHGQNVLVCLAVESRYNIFAVRPAPRGPRRGNSYQNAVTRTAWGVEEETMGEKKAPPKRGFSYGMRSGDLKPFGFQILHEPVIDRFDVCIIKILMNFLAQGFEGFSIVMVENLHQ